MDVVAIRLGTREAHIHILMHCNLFHFDPHYKKPKEAMTMLYMLLYLWVG